MSYAMTITGNEIEEVNNRLAKLSRKVANLGVAFIPEVTYIRRVLAATRETAETVVFDVGFNFEEFVLPGGWEFVATIEHGPAGNIIRSYEGAPELPLSVRTDAPTCDHCNIIRDRNNTIVVRNTAGDFKRVGSTCARSYLGIPATKLVPIMSDIASFHDENSFFGGSRAPADPTVEAVLFDSIASCLYGGFKPAAFQEDSTRSTVSMMLFPSSEESARYGETWRTMRSNVPEGAVEGALAWLKGQDDSSGYIHNLNAAVGIGSVSGRNMGLVVSLAGVYLRDIEKIETRKAVESLGPSEHIASVGDKSVEFIDAELVSASISDGYAYGSPDNIFCVLRVDGKNLVWVKTSVGSVFGSILNDTEKGDKVSFKATIKQHRSNRNDSAVTVVLRPKAL